MPYNQPKKIINRDHMSYSESPIDERYRLMLLEHYLDGSVEVPYRGCKKWQFICPFCASLSSKDYKKKHKKGSLLWDSRQHSWIFFCAKKGSVDCMNSKSFSNLITALNPALGEAYRRERWHSGTTGWGHNCKAPESVVGVATGSYGSMRSRSRP
jgi:hypothetical protein